MIEYLKVFATAEEIADIKRVRDLPLVAFTNPEPPGPGVSPTIPLSRPVHEVVHEYAIAHGLPEIPGWYGIDLEKGEFVVMR